jgi:outer membrane immunogenic protein
MRKLFRTAAAIAALPALSTAAAAADAPPAYELAPVYSALPFSWTGFYVGGNVGGAWDRRNLTDSLFGLNLSTQNDRGAFIGGGQLGFNYQVGNVVVGVEADFEGIANTNSPSTGVSGPIFGTIQVTSNSRWLASLAGRFGLTNDNWLFYGKAGGAWVGNDSFTIVNTVTNASISGSSNTSSGWVAGAGIEWAVTPNWSIKIEYDYIGLNSQTFTAPAGGFLGGDTFTTSNPNIQMVKIGANYLFKYWY